MVDAYPNSTYTIAAFWTCRRAYSVAHGAGKVKLVDYPCDCGLTLSVFTMVFRKIFVSTCSLEEMMLLQSPSADLSCGAPAISESFAALNV